VREAEDFGDTFGVDQVLGRNSWHPGPAYIVTRSCPTQLLA
jgi:hypothetical protein